MAEWISKDGELSLVPDFLTKLKPPIDAIFQTINVTLDLLQSILSFVKNFLIDFTQPIKIIIDLLIAQLKALLLDLKQLGVYFTSDADLIPEIKTSGLEPFGDGYSGFEARMVKKLTDISDPTRPNFSTASGTLSLFVVGSADFTNIIIVINAVMKLVDLFLGNFSDSPLPNPNNLKGTIKNGFLPVNIKTAKEYDGIKITWDISPPPNPKGSFFPSFVTPPASFLIHVRTRPTAWYAAYKFRPEGKTSPTDPEVSSLYYIGNQPVRVSGGVDLYNTNDTTFFVEDPSSDIEYTEGEIMDTGYTYYYKPSSVGSFLAGSSYSLSIDKIRLPLTYEYSYEVDATTGKKKVKTQTLVNTSKYFVEIVSCDTDLGLEDGARVLAQYTLPTETKPSAKIEQPNTIKTTNIVDTLGINVPLPETFGYLDALKNALAIYFLGSYFKDSPNTGLQLSERTQANIKAYIGKQPTDMDLNSPRDFRLTIKNNIGTIIDNMGMPDESVIRSLAKDVKNLITFYMFDPGEPGNRTSLYKLLDRDDETYVPGVTYNKEVYQQYLPTGVNDTITDKSLTLIYTSNSKVNDNLSPATSGGQVNSVRSLRDFIESTRGATPDGIMIKDSARKFLEYLPKRKPSVSGDGAWINYRFFEDGIPGIEEVVKKIIDFLESLSIGLDGIIKAIRDYIDLIILRIEELQILINKIKRIIDFLLGIKISANFAVLLTENNGTRGIVEGLLNSSNKPPYKDDDTLGFGACFVFGGYPQFLVDLLKAMFENATPA